MNQLYAADVNPGDALPALEVDVTARTVIMGASASRDWQPQHHDHRWAVERAGARDVFLNTPTLAGWFERYLTDWTGPMGRLGRLRFRMRRSICAGDRVAFSGTVARVTSDELRCHWASVDVKVTAHGETAVECSATVALPASADDNPWRRRGADWQP